MWVEHGAVYLKTLKMQVPTRRNLEYRFYIQGLYNLFKNKIRVELELEVCQNKM